MRKSSDLQPDIYLMFIAIKNGIKSPEIIAIKVQKSLKPQAIAAHYCNLQYYQLPPNNSKVIGSNPASAPDFAVM